MSPDRRSWTGSIRELGLATGDLLRAELAAIADELGASARALLTALLIAAVGGAFAFWALGLFVDLAIELFALFLPRWGAVAAVLGIFVLVAAVLLGWARLKLRRLESPAGTVRRRIEESRHWWSERIAPLDDEDAPEEEP